jgi:PAS domain S-box-containing protein
MLHGIACRFALSKIRDLDYDFYIFCTGSPLLVWKTRMRVLLYCNYRGNSLYSSMQSTIPPGGPIEPGSAEQALKTRESVYKALFEKANDGIFLIKGSTFVDCNPRVLDMFQCPREEIIGKTPDMFSPSCQSDGRDSREKALEWISAAVSGEPQFFEWEHLRCDGTPFYAEVSLSRIEAGGEMLLLGIVRDISERKLAERALNESEQKFRDLAEKSLVGIYLLQDDIFKYVNARFAEIHGYTAEEVADVKGPLDMVLPQDLERVKGNISKRITGESGPLHFGFRVVTRGGQTRHVEVYGSPTVYQGRPAVIGTLLDITERVLAEEKIRKLNRELHQRVAELRTANEELKALSYSISHDLKTPVITTEYFSRKLMDALSGRLDAESMEYLNIILTSSRRMGTLITDLLSFFGFGHSAIKSVTVDMEQTARQAFEELKVLYPEQPIKITIPPLPGVEGDEAMIRQVWVNLIGNALKYRKSGEVCSIEVGSSSEHGNLVYYVRDNGRGFPPDQAGRLFHVFERLHKEAGIEGTGIGLAIVKRIVERHGGKVWAEGSPGEGATFYFALPGTPAPKDSSIG